jgi:hypothetical protein
LRSGNGAERQQRAAQDALRAEDTPCLPQPERAAARLRDPNNPRQDVRVAAKTQ